MSPIRHSFPRLCAATGLILMVAGPTAHAPPATADPAPAKPVPVAMPLLTPAAPPNPAQQAKFLKGEAWAAAWRATAASRMPVTVPPDKTSGPREWAVSPGPAGLDPAAIALRMHAKQSGMAGLLRSRPTPNTNPEAPWAKQLPGSPAPAPGPSSVPAWASPRLTPQELAKAAAAAPPRRVDAKGKVVTP